MPTTCGTGEQQNVRAHQSHALVRGTEANGNKGRATDRFIHFASKLGESGEAGVTPLRG